MVFLRMSLYAGVCLSVLAGWAATESGHALEVAATRGVVALLALAFAGYVADLIVVTAPPQRHRQQIEGRAGIDGAAGEFDDHQDDASRAPVSLAAVREQQASIAPDRRAA